MKEFLDGRKQRRKKGTEGKGKLKIEGMKKEKSWKKGKETTRKK